MWRLQRRYATVFSPVDVDKFVSDRSDTDKQTNGDRRMRRQWNKVVQIEQAVPAERPRTGISKGHAACYSAVLVMGGCLDGWMPTLPACEPSTAQFSILRGSTAAAAVAAAAAAGCYNSVKSLWQWRAAALRGSDRLGTPLPRRALSLRSGRATIDDCTSFIRREWLKSGRPVTDSYWTLSR